MERETVHIESLEEQADHAIAEARMVLPGVQALLGFQLIAVFNQRFTVFSPREQALHFTAFLLIATATGLLMTPAAYHRQTGVGRITSHFVKVATRLIMVALWSLTVALAIDTWLIARIVFPAGATVATVAGAAVFLLLAGLWFVFPLVARFRRSAP